VLRIALRLTPVVGIVLACFDPTDVCGCPPEPFAGAVIAGVVRTEAGAPLPGIHVSARPLPADCTAEEGAASAIFASVSTADGSYEAWLQPWEGLDACAEVTAVRVLDGSAATDTVMAFLPVTLSLPPHPRFELDLVFPD
jgi:hypothetical protein